MFHSKPYKKDITPFAKGGKVVKHVGKGAREQSTSGGTRSTLTGGDPYARMMNSYPKPPPQDFSAPSQTPSPVPMGSQPPAAPTAMMPKGGDNEAAERMPDNEAAEGEA